METNQLLNLSPSQLRHAADLKERIDTLNDELGQILGGGNTAIASPNGNGGTKKRGMSGAGRKRMAEAAKARWAKVRAAQGQPTTGGTNSGTQKMKRTMSPAARNKIAAAARARWAKVRAARAA